MAVVHIALSESPKKTVSVLEKYPKLTPSTLMLPEPAAGPFGNGKYETTGESKVIGTNAVPMMLVTVATSALCFPSPETNLHVRVDADVQLDVLHTVPEKEVVGEGLAAPKLSPLIVTD